MKVFLVLCLVAGAFATRGCPDNSHYNDCGTMCPTTCDNYLNPPKVCVLMCNPGCHCDEGYVKTRDGRCVLPQDCNNNMNAVCGANQIYKECGTACPLTCDNYDNPPKICPAMCVSGCHCEEGYVKTNEGHCVRPENCPSRAEVNSCLMQPDEGMCRGYFPMFYYDAKTGQCQEFVYGGCLGNGNRFETEEECLEKCSSTRVYETSSDVCDQPIESGKCRAFKRRYGYDKETGRCKEFIYGGCGGNGNNFMSVDHCESTCVRQHLPTACQQKKDVGRCKAFLPRYFYNQETGECEHFIYGGCGANSNNFMSQEDCERVCKA